jgi:hypothetical protein
MILNVQLLHDDVKLDFPSSRPLSSPRFAASPFARFTVSPFPAVAPAARLSSPKSPLPSALCLLPCAFCPRLFRLPRTPAPLPPRSLATHVLRFTVFKPNIHRQDRKDSPTLITSEEFPGRNLPGRAFQSFRVSALNTGSFVACLAHFAVQSKRPGSKNTGRCAKNSVHVRIDRPGGGA